MGFYLSLYVLYDMKVITVRGLAVPASPSAGRGGGQQGTARDERVVLCCLRQHGECCERNVPNLTISRCFTLESVFLLIVMKSALLNILSIAVWFGIVKSQNKAWDFHSLSLSEYPEARCLDGTPGGNVSCQFSLMFFHKFLFF